MKIEIELSKEQLQWLQYGMAIIIDRNGLAFNPEPELQDALETFNALLQEYI